MRLREATNGTELKRLQLLYDNVADELNSANEDLNKEPGIFKARVHTLMNEVNRAKAGEAERLGCWHLRLSLQNPSLDPAMARLVEEITEFDIYTLAIQMRSLSQHLASSKQLQARKQTMATMLKSLTKNQRRKSWYQDQRTIGFSPALVRPSSPEKVAKTKRWTR